MMTDKPSAVYLSGFLTQLQSSHLPRLDASALQQGGTVMAVPLGLQDFRLGPAVVAHPQLLPFGKPPTTHHPILPLAHQLPVADPETLRAQAQLLQLLQQRPILPGGAPAATQLTTPLHPHITPEDRRSRFSVPSSPRSRRDSGDFVPTRPSPAGTEESESGGRLAISFLLNESNPTDHAHANPPSVDRGQKRKAEHHQRSSILEAPQRHLLLSPEEMSDDRVHVRRRLDRDGAAPSDSDARRSPASHTSHASSYHGMPQPTSPQGSVLPSLSSLVGSTSLPSPDQLLYRASPQRAGPSPHTTPIVRPHPLPLDRPSASPPSPVATSLSLTASNPSFFYNSFNCLPAVSSNNLNNDDEAELASSGSSTDNGTGFYYVPYERSRSLPASPKLAAEDDSFTAEGDHLPPPAPLNPAQVQLRLQTQALQTQLLLRQMQRKQNIQQLKRLHAKQLKLRGGPAAESAEKATTGDEGHGEEEASGCSASAGEAQIEDKLKLLKMKIMSSDLKARGSDVNSQEKRRRATPQQLKLLEEVFALDPFPSREAKQLLAQRLGMDTRSITVWFQNKRARLKKFGEKNPSY